MNSFFRSNNKNRYINKCLTDAYKKKEEIPDVLYKKISFKAPRNFSLIENPHETVEYFNDILNFACSVKTFVKIRFDLSEVENITIDSIIYMIALSVNIFSEYRPNFNVLVPQDEKLKEFILSSGIADFFNAKELEVTENGDYFSIKMGNQTDVELAQNICDFTNHNLKSDFKETKFLYDMLIEMMTNTGQHAYTKRDKIQTQWLIFAEYVGSKIRYTFIDTGLGIPQTMSKYIISVSDKDVEKDEFIINILDHFAKEDTCDTLLLVTGLMGGSFRSRTEKAYRGKGLPEIYDHYKERHKTSNLKIISGACLCEFDEKDRGNPIVTELKEKFLGTLFYWEIDKDDLKKGNAKNEI